MHFKSPEALVKYCEDNGEDAIRAYVDSGQAHADEIGCRVWLMQQERTRLNAIADNEALARENERKENRVQLERSLKAAEQSAKWTMWAAFAAFASVVIPLAIKLLGLDL